VKHITAQAAETERIGEVAAQALADIHSAIYGHPPAAARAWTDGDAILLVMRIPPETAGQRAEPPLSSIQRMVITAVQRRTGESLRAASTSLDAERGLVVLAFERVPAAQPDPGALPAGPVLGSG
jgi:hypothetical protein